MRELGDYEQIILKLWQSMPDIEESTETKIVADKILDYFPRYAEITQITQVPECLIGAIHYRECSLRWDCHFYNGDPLTSRTVRFPLGLPRVGSPPFTWEESAEAALVHQGLHEVETWDIVSMLDRAERYNGLGYRHKNLLSPYIWALGYETKGVYKTDGVYSPRAIEKRPGVAVILRALQKRGVKILSPDHNDENGENLLASAEKKE